MTDKKKLCCVEINLKCRYIMSSKVLVLVHRQLTQFIMKFQGFLNALSAPSSSCSVWDSAVWSFRTGRSDRKININLVSTDKSNTNIYIAKNITGGDMN